MATLKRIDNAGIEALCLSLPGCTADIKWGGVRVFSVAEKMFCAFALDEGPFGRVSFKVDDERFLELTDQPGLIPAPYLARHHWVCLTTADALPAAGLEALIRRSHALVASKLSRKLRAQLQLD